MDFDHKRYFKYLHESYLCCAVCRNPNIELHHITDINEIPNEPRRDHKRVISLCPEHHRLGKNAIHIMSKDNFYKKVMPLHKMLEFSKNLFNRYEKNVLNHNKKIKGK
jgi:hypothetical protein